MNRDDKGGKRALIYVLVRQGTLNGDDRIAAVKDLLNDGLTMKDIMELIPRLVIPSLSMRAETTSAALPSAQTTLVLAHVFERSTDSAREA